MLYVCTCYDHLFTCTLLHYCISVHIIVYSLCIVHLQAHSEAFGNFNHYDIISKYVHAPACMHVAS